MIFDTVTGTVAMPSGKISKAQQRRTRAPVQESYAELAHRFVAPRSNLHPPAQAFLQRLRVGEAQLHRSSRGDLSSAMRDDLAWWWRILHDPALNGVRLEYFGELPQPEIVVATDASDVGLCALVPSLQCALTYQFSPSERAQITEFNQGVANEFDINYRELLACTLAFQAWAPTWRASHTQPRPLHVHFRIDNTSAVVWQTKMASRNTRDQILIRLLGIWEQQLGLRFSVSRVPGVENGAADAGSQRWEDVTYAQRFNDFVAGWG